jgi:PleD family two-component response regulator
LTKLVNEKNTIYPTLISSAKVMKKKILIIDDDATIRFLVHKILDPIYDVVSKGDGYEAIDWLNAGNNADLILVDMEMPNINGRVLIKRIRFTPKFRHVPIIVISGTDSKLIRTSFFKLGATDYIVKPFTPIDFTDRITKALNGERMRFDN